MTSCSRRKCHRKYPSNDLITEGTIRGPKLEYCDPQFENCIPDGSKYADYLIDPYPTEGVEYKPTLINALEIGSKNIEFDGSVEEDSKVSSLWRDL